MCYDFFEFWVEEEEGRRRRNTRRRRKTFTFPGSRRKRELRVIVRRRGVKQEEKVSF